MPYASPVRIRPGPHHLVVSLGGSELVVFDGLGRPVYAYLDAAGYRRGFNNQVLMTQVRAGAKGVSRLRQALDPDGRRAFFTQVSQSLETARTAAVQGQSVIHGGRGYERLAIDWLDRALSWDDAALEADAAEFCRIYPHPVSILPPDRYLSVVLQVTEGCAYNRCTFCMFYRDRRYRTRSMAEFRSQALAVRRFMGTDSGRRGVFLADANAVTLSLGRLNAYLGTARDIFGPEMAGPGGGFYSFLDVFTGVRRDSRHWAGLAALGLRRVYLGVETGSPELLRFLDKPAAPAAVRELVAMLRAAGIAVGVMVMAGVGGDRYAAVHTEATAALVQALGLCGGDILYISQFTVHPGSPYEQHAAAEGIHPATPGQVGEQIARFRQAARQSAHAGPRVAIYPILDFIY